MSGGRTATVRKPNELDIAEAAVPEPAPDQVVVKVRYCGVCGTDVHGFQTPDMLPQPSSGTSGRARSPPSASASVAWA